jgi:CRP-like cAMP-binding protein
MDVNDVARLLGRTEACLGMDREHLLAIAAAGDIRVSFENAELTTEGQPGASMLLLLDGTADVVKGDGTGHGRVIASVSGGALLGEMALLESARRTATVRATSACRYFEIQKTTFDGLLNDGDRSATRLLLGIARVLVRRQRTTGQRLTSLIAAATQRSTPVPEIDAFLKDIVIEVEV